MKRQIYRSQDIQNHKETKSPQQVITDQMVFKVKKLIPDCLMISVKDKNVGQLRVECQLYAQRRIQKEIVSSKSFEKSNRKVHDILEDLKREYRSADVNHLGYWYKGSYTLPKQKDPINKSRLIASYFKHPLRHVFKNVSRILTWMFTTIKKRYGMFTLYKLTDIKERLSDAMRVLTKTLDQRPTSFQYKLMSHKCTRT